MYGLIQSGSVHHFQQHMSLEPRFLALVSNEHWVEPGPRDHRVNRGIVGSVGEL